MTRESSWRGTRAMPGARTRTRASSRAQQQVLAVRVESCEPMAAEGADEDSACLFEGEGVINGEGVVFRVLREQVAGTPSTTVFVLTADEREFQVRQTHRGELLCPEEFRGPRGRKLRAGNAWQDMTRQSDRETAAALRAFAAAVLSKAGAAR